MKSFPIKPTGIDRTPAHPLVGGASRFLTTGRRFRHLFGHRGNVAWSRKSRPLVVWRIQDLRVQRRPTSDAGDLQRCQLSDCIRPLRSLAFCTTNGHYESFSGRRQGTRSECPLQVSACRRAVPTRNVRPADRDHGYRSRRTCGTAQDAQTERNQLFGKTETTTHLSSTKLTRQLRYDKVSTN